MYDVEGCEWNMYANRCNVKGAPRPCQSFYDKRECGKQAHCTYNEPAHTCIDKGLPFDSLFPLLSVLSSTSPFLPTSSSIFIHHSGSLSLLVYQLLFD